MNAWLIIDGYNLIRRTNAAARTGESALLKARRQLIRQLDEVAGALASRTTVVFDGTSSDAPDTLGHGGVEEVFSSSGSADMLIERMVCSEPVPSGVLVVTSDRGIRDTVTAAGADVMSCRAFIDLIEVTRGRLRNQIRTMAGKTPGARLGDFFPKT